MWRRGGREAVLDVPCHREIQFEFDKSFGLDVAFLNASDKSLHSAGQFSGKNDA